MRKKSLQLRILSLTIIILFGGLITLTYVFGTTQNRSLLSSADQTLSVVTQIVNQSIRAIMLNGEAPIAVRTMENLQLVNGVENIAIYRRDGTIAFSDYETVRQVNSNLRMEMFDETPRIPVSRMSNVHMEQVLKNNTPVKYRNREKRYLEYYYPLLNTPDCRRCHGNDQFIRGIEHVQVSIQPVYDQIRLLIARSAAILFGTAVILTLFIVLFLRRIVVLPLLQIGNIVQQVGEGNFEVSLNLDNRDEIGTIAIYTNEMIKGLKERTREIQLTQDVTILSLASLAETRDNETGNHILRTQHYIKVIAEYLGNLESFREELTDEDITMLFKSAPLHDIGKVGVPDAILLKPGPLTDDEWKEMRKHPAYGLEALRVAEKQLGTTSFLSMAQQIIIGHHEKWDGSGYPMGLKGTDIPLAARLMALADVYDALVTERPYKKAFSHEEAREIITRGSGCHFDPHAVEAFLASEEQFIVIAGRYID